MTNLMDLHTSPAGSVHLIGADVPILDSQLLMFAGDVVECPGARVPICVNVVGGRGSIGVFLLGEATSEGGVEVLVALDDRVAHLATQLTLHIGSPV